MRAIYTLYLFLFVSFPVYLSAKPMIWNIAQLASSKNVQSEAKQDIIDIANKEIKRTVRTVMDKPLTPISGDKHDYMSMGPYWWPNPDTADGLPYIRKDGQRNPESKYLDRNAMFALVSNVVSLSLAYYFTDDNQYAHKAIENLSVWFINPETIMNPHLNYGQTVPGRYDGKGRCYGIIDTYVLVELLEAISLLETSETYTDRIRQGLEQWFSAYLDWLLNSELGKLEFNTKNNHAVAYDVQVVRMAAFVGRTDLALEFIHNFPERRIFQQIASDGSQPHELERMTAFSYSVYNLSILIDMCAIADNYGIDLLDISSDDSGSILQAVDFLIPYLGVDLADFPYQQIGDWDRVQMNFAFLLYRIDKMREENLYRKHYLPFTSKQLRRKDHLIF